MKTMFLIAIVVIFSCVGSAQERLSEAAYNIAIAKALEASSARDRRVLTTETYYDGSRVKGTRKIVSDFVGPDAKRVEVNEEFNGIKTKSDSIKSSDGFFCRDGDKGWKRADKECAKKDGMLAIPDGEYAYSVEQDPDNLSRKIYWRRATFADAGSPERDAVRLKFIEIKIVADENGMIEHTETRRGGLDQDGWSSIRVTRYENDPKDLKIDTPNDRL